MAFQNNAFQSGAFQMLGGAVSSIATVWAYLHRRRRRKGRR